MRIYISLRSSNLHSEQAQIEVLETNKIGMQNNDKIIIKNKIIFTRMGQGVGHFFSFGSHPGAFEFQNVLYWTCMKDINFLRHHALKSAQVAGHCRLHCFIIFKTTTCFFFFFLFRFNLTAEHFNHTVAQPLDSYKKLRKTYHFNKRGLILQVRITWNLLVTISMPIARTCT